MKTCPWCGRKNLDSDQYCFNCERNLNAMPGEEETQELETEIRRTRVYKPPSMIRLVLISILRKVLFGLLALGGFFIFALLAIWLSYDNEIVALAALVILGAALLVALYYPDFKLSRRIGTRGVPASILANVILLGVILPPTLWFLSRRGYIAGAWEFLGHFWWAFVAFLVLGCFIAWLAGRRTSAETASP